MFYNFRDCFLMKSAISTSVLNEANYSSDTLSFFHGQLKERFKFYPLIKHVHLHAITLVEVCPCFMKKITMHVCLLLSIQIYMHLLGFHSCD